MSTEERRNGTELEGFYKTKVVQFFGRSVPIILQNDNGPCPLIAISNVLLLRNNLNLSLGTSEIPLQKLLSLVAERLIDSNSNVEDKDAGYVNNQQQNIADAIDMLPRLATGIDVNLHFEKIDDFEFTPERAIFDLLGIELYHGWIVDPQDTATLAAIGSKSYNALMGEVVAIEAHNIEEDERAVPGDDCIDFAAATTATLGIPSPSLSSARSFEDSPFSENNQKMKKGDLEEEEELMRVLQLSRSDTPSYSEEVHDANRNASSVSNENASPSQSRSEFLSGLSEGKSVVEPNNYHQSERNVSQECSVSVACIKELSSENVSGDLEFASSDSSARNHLSQSKFIGPEVSTSEDLGENTSTSGLTQHLAELLLSERDMPTASHTSEEIKYIPNEALSHAVELGEQSDNKSEVLSSSATPMAGLDCSDSKNLPLDVSQDLASSLTGSEPIYEGEECILESGHLDYESREPMYEGEIVLAEQTDTSADGNACGPADEFTQQSDDVHRNNTEKAELIKNFLKNNASQLTIYGLFCLQEGLKERELCVFFRNNHFSTMFKLNGELYLLATDQGYFNQPDLVWEKLNEVNGDSIFMTGNFNEFKAESHLSDSWDGQNDYPSSIDNPQQTISTLNYDLQLAIALQQQEFENQPPRQTPNPPNPPKPSVSVNQPSRLVTGPLGSRNSSSTSTQCKEGKKEKDRCVVM